MTLWGRFVKWMHETMRLGSNPPVSDPKEKEDVQAQQKELQMRLRLLELQEQNIRRES